MIEQSKLVWEFLGERGAFFYVAGNSKNMPKSVRDAVIEIAEREGGLQNSDAENFVSNLEKTGKYQTETWA